MTSQPPLSEVLDTVPAEAASWPLVAYRAAGGVVVDGGRVLLLLLRHRHEVRLPKGHIEDGEAPEACALREVREESGLRRPTIVRLLGTVHNRFAHQGRRFDRAETWFLMAADAAAADAPEPQFTPVWYPLAAAEAALTFESERIALRWALAAAGAARGPQARPQSQ